MMTMNMMLKGIVDDMPTVAKVPAVYIEAYGVEMMLLQGFANPSGAYE